MQPVTLSRGVKITAAVFGVLMLGLLALNNIQIGGQLAIVKQQRDFQAQADPLVRDGRILAEDLRDRLPQSKRAARDAASLVRATRPLVGDLNELDLHDVLGATGSLAQGLNSRNRLVRLVDRSDRLIGQIEDSRLLQRTPEALEELLRIQRETSELQRQSLAVQRETLAIQKEALVHIRSIDRKTGGPAPGAVPPPAG